VLLLLQLLQLLIALFDADQRIQSQSPVVAAAGADVNLPQRTLVAVMSEEDQLKSPP
jgi:hypothetical protein